MIALAAALVIAAAPSPTPSPAPATDPCAGIMAAVTRPTVASSVCTARYGHVVLENGYTNTTTTGSGGGHTVSYAQSYVHIPIAQNVEIELIAPSYERVATANAISSGWNDSGAGLKWVDELSGRAQIGLQGQYTFASGSPGFTNGAAEGTLGFNWAYQLSPAFSMGGTVSYTSYVDAYVPSIVVTHPLGAASQAFAEYAYFSRAGIGLAPKSLIDFGYSGDVTPHLQFDLEYGLQLNELQGQRAHYVGAGLSFMN